MRAWLRAHRAEHDGDDPGAAHVQVRRLSRVSRLTGGVLVAPEEVLRDEPLRTVDE